MSSSNRASAIAKLHTALKKHYKAEPTQPTRPLLEHILYASLLEDCPAELADEGLAKCEQEFFDWNEVRVTTVTELSQVLSRLPDPIKAATRLKTNLQSIFEEFYTFDLDHLKKENLGKAVAKFEKMPGMSPFVLNYTIQHGLGGHAIPVDFAAMAVMLVTGIASQTEAVSGRVPGLERAIPKSKAIEFSSLLHQAAVALNNDAKDKTGRAVLDMVDKGASSRLDDWLVNKVEAKKQRAIQREADRVAAEEAENAPPEVVEKTKSSKKPAADKAAAEKATSDKPATEKAATEKPAGKAVAEKTDAKKTAAAKPVVKKTDKDAKPASESKSSKSAKKSEKSSATKPAAKTEAAKPVKKTSEKKSSPDKKAAAPAAKTPASKSKKSSSAAKEPAAKSTPSSKSKKTSEPQAKASGTKKSTNRKLTKSKPR